jgi:hypothetical protein
MDDRYRNVRGSVLGERDRNEARVHAEDIIAIVSVQSDPLIFQVHFDRQFGSDRDLETRVHRIVQDYFGSRTAPGYLLYEEFLVANRPAGDSNQRNAVITELDRAYSLMRCLLPRSQNFQLLRNSLEDILDTHFTESFLSDLQEHSVIATNFDHVLPLLPLPGSAFEKGQVFESAPSAFAKLDDFERELIQTLYRQLIEQLQQNQPHLLERFPSVFGSM